MVKRKQALVVTPPRVQRLWHRSGCGRLGSWGSPRSNGRYLFGLTQFGQFEDGKVRFRPTQAMLLDAMLDAQVTVDAGFRMFRKKLRSFTGVKPKSAPRGFQGKLRSYQSEGLGWLHFLREFNLGGCLADDMGLGKTIQVLALLESRRTRRIKPTNSNATKKIPSAESKPGKENKNANAVAPIIITATAQLKRKPLIVVVPKSLIFNWIEEAAKFTPTDFELHRDRSTDQGCRGNGSRWL